VLVAVLATPVAFAQDQPPAAPPRQLSLANTPWQGDFAQMLERRVIRVLIPYSRTLFFNDKGRDYLLFYEYFHGDNGAGLGASHQTGWTGVITRAMHLFASTSAKQLLEGSTRAGYRVIPR
jgi:hypothetical protein